MKLFFKEYENKIVSRSLNFVLLNEVELSLHRISNQD